MKEKLTPIQEKLTPTQEKIIHCISMVIENNIYCQKMANETMKNTLEEYGPSNYTAFSSINKSMEHNENMAKINIGLIQKLLQSGVGTDTVEWTEFIGRYVQIKLHNFG